MGLSVVYIVGYNGMVATYAWLCGAEFPSQRLRSYTFGLATSIGFFGAWLAAFTAPYFINPDSLNWGPKYGYIWFPSCLIGAIWTFFFLPEVQNRTFEEIDEMVCNPILVKHLEKAPKNTDKLTKFEARLPARKFRQYKCIGSVAAVAAAAQEDRVALEKEIQLTRVSHEETVRQNAKGGTETAVAHL